MAEQHVSHTRTLPHTFHATLTLPPHLATGCRWPVAVLCAVFVQSLLDLDDAALDDYIPISVVSSTAHSNADRTLHLACALTFLLCAPLSPDRCLCPHTLSHHIPLCRLLLSCSCSLHTSCTASCLCLLQWASNTSASSFPTAAPSLANTQSVSNRSIHPTALLSARREANTATSGPPAAATGSASAVGGYGSFGYMSGPGSSSSVMNINGVREKDKRQRAWTNTPQSMSEQMLEEDCALR